MIETLNKEYSEDMQELVSELVERDEFICTIHVGECTTNV